ncbi:MAG: hypothetical protein ACLT0Y_00620 [Christensenellales bacterium]
MPYIHRLCFPPRCPSISRYSASSSLKYSIMAVPLFPFGSVKVDVFVF